jgi:hypothetical protein
VSKGYGMVTVEQDVELRVVRRKLCLCHPFVCNYYITLSNKSVLSTSCIFKRTKGETTELREYGNCIPSRIFLLCFFLSKKFLFLGSATISD